MQQFTNAALEFHDSEVRDVLHRGGDLVIAFSAAYVHRSIGRPGVDSGAGYLTALSMIFRSAEWAGDLQMCHGKLSDGEFQVSGARLSLVPLPYTSSAPVSAQLQFANGATLSINAKSVVCKPTGEGKFVESYAC